MVFENHRKSRIRNITSEASLINIFQNVKKDYFGEFLKTWSMRSNSLTYQIGQLYKDKNWWKMTKI